MKDSKPEWSEEAKKKLEKVPFFLRKKVKSLVEEYAAAKDISHISGGFLDDARQEFFRKVSKEASNVEAPESELFFELQMCRGSSLGCPFSLRNNEELVKKLEEVLTNSSYIKNLKDSIEGLILPHHKFKISISACPNSCSQPQVKDFGVQTVSFPRRGEKKCTMCRRCVESCIEGAITLGEEGPTFDLEKCIGCGTCHRVCAARSIVPGEEGVRVFLGGKLGRHPRLGTPLPGVLSYEEIPQILEKCLQEMEEKGYWGKRLGELMEKEENALLFCGETEPIQEIINAL